MNWAVVHLIHIRTPHRHIAKLFVTDVPEDVSARELRSALTRAGWQFGEFGVPWANHYLNPETDWEDEVVGAYGQGGVKTIDWSEIAPHEVNVKRFTLRLPLEVWQAVAEAAEKQGVSINTFAISALSAAANLNQE